MDWAQILVVLLAICLILFVVVAATLLIIILRITLQIKSLMRSAHEVSEHITQALAEAGMMTKVVDIIGSLGGKVKRFRKRRNNE